MAQEEGRGGFIGIRVSGGAERVFLQGNSIDITGPGAGIVIDDHPLGPKHIRVERNKIKHRLPEPPALQRSWIEGYLVDVFSGGTVLALAIFCAWLGLST